MIIETLNSYYKIDQTMFGDVKLYEITKVMEINCQSRYIALGETRLSRTAEIELGCSAQFDNWSTSKVVAINPKRPGEKELLLKKQGRNDGN